MMTRVTPLSSQASTVAVLRMPPPSCTGIFTSFKMRSTAAAFIGLPAKAPSRSTMCRYSKPCVSKARACAAGSRLNTVARAMSPCSSRTARPSFRSMAGKRITAFYPHRHSGARAKLANPESITPVLRSMDSGSTAARCPGMTALWLSRRQLQTIGDQLQAQPLALLRVKLGADHVVAPDDGGERAAIVGLRHQLGAVRGFQLVRVHEICVQPVRPERDVREQRVRPQHVERVPAHVRDFQRRVRRRDAVDLAGDPAEAGRHLVFAPALGHQLHA